MRNHQVKSDWYLANYLYLNKAVETVLQALLARVAQQKNQPTQEVSDIQSTLEAMEASMSAPSALSHLCNVFDLSLFERHILLMCVGMNISPKFGSLCADAIGDIQLSYPTFALALEVLPEASWSALTTQSPLQYWQLIEIASGVAPALCRLQIDKSILCYLMGEPCLSDKLQGVVKPIPIEANNNIPLQPSHQKLVEQLAAVWSSAVDKLAVPIVQLCGDDLTATHSITSHACASVGCSLLLIKAHRLPSLPDDLNYILRRCEREAILSNSALLLDCNQVNIADATKLSAIEQLIENISSRLIITSRERLPLSQSSFITFDVSKLTSSEQLAIWQNTLAEAAIELNPSVETLVSQFNLSQEGIYTAVSTAKGIINTNPISATDTNKEATALWDSCRIMARPQLDDLAQRINTNATWDDLVLPDQQQQLLREMIIHVQHRLTVYEKWGFANKSDRGLGIAALFSGISGTGKTMSAEVIANELRLDLYRIDLSAVVSKYIGETEKNLRRIFDAAEAGGAVLLFDEADALFSKRTEVKDSHDRNANLETNYLLQRLEAYQGLAILTTNLRNSIDSAFMRRIRFVVEFEFPTPEIREQIWQQVFPKDTPTLELDYAKLARLNVPGGNIRSIAMNAAFLAAATAEPVQMKHLLNATISEGRKTGLSLGNHTKGWV